MSLASFSLVLGVVCYVLGFPMAVSDNRHLSWRKKFLRDENVIRILSVFALSVSALALRSQHVITPDGEGIIIFFAWVAFLEGVLMALVPAWYIRMKTQMSKTLLSSDGAQAFWGSMFILFGAFFTYMGTVLQ